MYKAPLRPLLMSLPLFLALLYLPPPTYLDCPNSSIQSPRRIMSHTDSDCPDVSPWLWLRFLQPTPSSPNLPPCYLLTCVCTIFVARSRRPRIHSSTEHEGTERKEIVINCRVTMLPIMAQLPGGLIQFPCVFLVKLRFYCRISLFTF